MLHWYQTQQQDLEAGARAIESANERITKAEENLTKAVNELSVYQEENKLGDFAPQIEKNTGKTQKALEEEKRILDSLELRLMRDSLAKKLRQMDEEERQTIQKLQENGRKSADAVKRIHNYYAVLRLNQIKDYLKDTETLIKDTQKNIDNFQFKLNMVELYLSSEVSYQELSLAQGINNPTLICKWVNDFQIAGPDALRPQKKGRKKSLDSKVKTKTAVQTVSEAPVDTSAEHIKQLEDELLKLRIENAYLKELRRLRLEEEALLKKQRESSTVSEENSN